MAENTICGHCAKTHIKRIFTLQRRAVRYIARLEPLESCIDSFIQLKILTLYSLYIKETILYLKEKSNCMVSKQLHACDTRKHSYSLFKAVLQVIM
jgi:hypothetical protein